MLGQKTCVVSRGHPTYTVVRNLSIVLWERGGVGGIAIRHIKCTGTDAVRATVHMTRQSVAHFAHLYSSMPCHRHHSKGCNGAEPRVRRVARIASLILVI